LRRASAALAALVLASGVVRAQDAWAWGWAAPDTLWAEDALLHDLAYRRPGLGESAIDAYQRVVAPRMGRPCPAWPSCSMYTRYAVARWGLAPGVLLGIDRIFFREHAAFTGGRTAFTFRLDGRTRVYDPPDANVARLLRDWRQLHPDYRALRAGPDPARPRHPERLGVHVAR
jgi:putative component of membrane protein insertase Oxa1/YidC/SpoIIIJ protein YidD